MSSDEEEMYMEADDFTETTQEDEFLDEEDLEEDMKQSIESVHSVLQVSNGMCRLLLQKYKWSKDALLDRFYENPDPVSFLIDAHILPSQSVTNGSGDTAPPTECQICCMDGEELSGLACNHLACNDCWKCYLQSKIKEGQSEIQCMASDCKLLLEDETVLKYIKDAESYRKVLVNSYVETNKMLRWCPGKNCGKAVKVAGLDRNMIICPCGSRFCFTCGLEGHEPINCRLLKLWIKRCQDDSETYNWINANTKDCPKCNAPIEKNGGCNYMRCQNTSCKFEFCWLCFGSWKDEGAHNCNRFDEKKDGKGRDQARISLEKYLFYYNRYINHLKSLQLERKLKDLVAEKMESMQEMTMSWVEVQFLDKAVSVLSECRRTLMYTYAFAFYLQRDNNSIIFEANQKDLETSTEQLSHLLERELDFEDLVVLKQKVQDKYRYVEQRRKVLLDHCAEGKDLDFWVFNE
ncbi:unnamed protein product [Caenorhabditis brenneri]